MANLRKVQSYFLFQSEACMVGAYEDAAWIRLTISPPAGRAQLML
jgi:hypothetical protein